MLALLNNREYEELRRVMALTHLRTYDNLRNVVEAHLNLEGVWRPIVEVDKLLGDGDTYIARLARLLQPTFGHAADEQPQDFDGSASPRKLEEALRKRVLEATISGSRISESMFRSMCDRLVSLRLLNLMRDEQLGCGYDKSYTPCVLDAPYQEWYTLLTVEPSSGGLNKLFFCEPDLSDSETLDLLINATDRAFPELVPAAGYYRLPEVRDKVCQYLRIPEASFDEGMNLILDIQPSPFTVGLQYEGITGRRKPLVRDRGNTQIYNLIRRA